MQRAEVYLITKKSKKKEVPAPSPGPGAKPKKTPTKMKMLSPKTQKDETLEVSLCNVSRTWKIKKIKIKKLVVTGLKEKSVSEN